VTGIAVVEFYTECYSLNYCCVAVSLCAFARECATNSLDFRVTLRSVFKHGDSLLSQFHNHGFSEIGWEDHLQNDLFCVDRDIRSLLNNLNSRYL